MFNTKKLPGFILAFSATALWASFYIVSRFVFGENAEDIDPIFFSFLRFLMASVFAIALTIHQKKTYQLFHAVKNDFRMFLFLGLIGIVGEGILVFWSLKYTTATRSSLFANTSPIFTVIIALFALKEKLNLRKLAGMLLGFGGVLIAISSKSKGDLFLSSTSVIGDLLALGSGICWAGYTVWGIKVSKKYGSILSTTVVILSGTIMLFFIVILAKCPVRWDLSLNLWLATIYMGVFVNGLAYICWYAALKYLNAGEVGAFGYISLILTVIMSSILLHEKFSFLFFIAIFGVLAGVYLMMEKRSINSAKCE